MKNLLLYILFLTPVTFSVTSCHITQQQPVTTLLAVGYAAKSTIDTTAILLREGKITVAQFEKVALFYDTRFQPVFRLAVNLADGDTSKPAATDLVKLVAELKTLLR